MILYVLISVILLRIITNSMSNVFQKKLANNGEHPARVNFINYLLMSIFSLPILLFLEKINYTADLFLYALLGGIFGAVCNLFMVMALESGQLSVLGPINAYKAVVGLIFGIFILHEYPNIYGILGMILVIFGSYFIFDSPKDILKKDIMYRFCALFFSAIEAVFIKKVIILSSISVSFVLSSCLGAVFSFILMKNFYKKEIRFENSKNLLYLLTAVCFGVMTFATAFVFKYINVGYALSLFQLSIILNVFLGYKLFQEKNLLKKLAGSLIIIIGSTTILLFGN